MELSKIKSYCNAHKIKFDSITKNGFIAIHKVNINAGMEFIFGSGYFISIPIKKIGIREVKEKFICFQDGDIIGDGFIKN